MLNYSKKGTKLGDVGGTNSFDVGSSKYSQVL